jgi:hydroxyacylglutathione hydrolase
MRVLPVPCLSDNYAYLVHQDGAGQAVVIDPSEAEPVIAALEREGLTLAAIVNTHHHFDHVGGNAGLVARYGAVPVAAHVSDRGRVPEQTLEIEDGKPFELAGLRFEPLHVPGHTSGAVAYVVDGAVFTGDTLFVAGCGRLFEGTPAQMHASLNEKLGRLPPETKVYCGHEYTVSNLRFAASMEPGSLAVKEKLARAQATRERGEPTVPSTIGEELATNPFLRVTSPELRGHAATLDAGAVEVFAAVRAAKDGFR